jgi:hypothetical protein
VPGALRELPAAVLPGLSEDVQVRGAHIGNRVRGSNCKLGGTRTHQPR